LGRVVAEYPRLDQMARAPAGEHVVEIEGFEHLEAARRAGRGAILMSGHYGFFEMTGAFLGQIHPLGFVVRPMSNPAVDAWIRELRARAGVQSIEGTGIRAIYEKLRDNEWVAMLADQDARRQGVFVPFFGRLASTPLGPARIALATGAPIIMGRAVRRADGRHDLRIEPALEVGDGKAADAAVQLTARHVAVLERWVRERPELWFWLHRRWKTRPAEEGRRASV
jgi:KDO2-lipid IV(A) lauroyltransferase